MVNFELGRMVMTHRIHRGCINCENFSRFVEQSIVRYKNTDWGSTSKEAAKQNDDAIKNGEQIVAVYKYDSETNIWIVTEADRSVTTILFPDEY